MGHHAHLRLFSQLWKMANLLQRYLTFDVRAGTFNFFQQAIPPGGEIQIIQAAHQAIHFLFHQGLNLDEEDDFFISVFPNVGK
jgi:hypothetical protein